MAIDGLTSLECISCNITDIVSLIFVKAAEEYIILPPNVRGCHGMERLHIGIIH